MMVRTLWSSGWDPVLPLLKSQVQSPVRSGESDPACCVCMAKKKKKIHVMNRVRAGILTAEQCRQESFLCWKKSHTQYIGTHCYLLSEAAVEATGFKVCRLQVHVSLASGQIH